MIVKYRKFCCGARFVATKNRGTTKGMYIVCKVLTSVKIGKT